MSHTFPKLHNIEASTRMIEVVIFQLNQMQSKELTRTIVQIKIFKKALYNQYLTTEKYYDKYHKLNTFSINLDKISIIVAYFKNNL
jgi:hypothetical protein